MYLRNSMIKILSQHELSCALPEHCVQQYWNFYKTENIDLRDMWIWILVLLEYTHTHISMQSSCTDTFAFCAVLKPCCSWSPLYLVSSEMLRLLYQENAKSTVFYKPFIVPQMMSSRTILLATYDWNYNPCSSAILWLAIPYGIRLLRMTQSTQCSTEKKA